MGMFKRLVLCAGLVALVAGCLEQSSRKNPAGPLYRHHFVGSTAAGRSTNAAKLKEIWALPASRTLQEQIVGKIARVPHELLKAPKSGPDHADLFRPLIEDLLRQESFVEVRDRAKKSEAVLAIQLDDARARIWQTNLIKALTSWKQGTPADVTVGTTKGWQIQRSGVPKFVQFFRAKEWVVVGIGQEDLTLASATLEQIAKTGRPVVAMTNDWLDLTVDLPAVKKRFPLLASQELPLAHLTVGGLGGTLRTEGRLTYPEPVNWKYEPWKIPMKTVTEPLISFTVARGVAPILKNSPAFRELGLKETPNQYCVWGLQHEFSFTSMAVPVSDGSNVITRLAHTLPPLAQKYMPGHFGHFLWVSNRAEIIWQGLPFIVPRIHPVRETNGDFVVANLFPKVPNTNPPPKELMAQFMNRTNLVYYDWEITPERVKHGNQMLQLYNIANDLMLPKSNDVAQAWLLRAGPLLGNTVTELTLSSPQELSLIRKSHLGFTGFELAALMRWVESPGFPLRYDPPASLRDARLKAAAARTNAPGGKFPGTNAPRAKPPGTPPPQ